MGMTPATTDGARTEEAGRGPSRPAPSAAAAASSQIGALAAVLGSEDSLFRDPFADFTPSGR